MNGQEKVAVGIVNTSWWADLMYMLALQNHLNKDVFRKHDFMARGLITAIVENTESEPSFAEALHVQQVIAACQLSAKENRRVWIENVNSWRSSRYCKTCQV